MKKKIFIDSFSSSLNDDRRSKPEGRKLLTIDVTFISFLIGVAVILYRNQVFFPFLKLNEITKVIFLPF